MTIWIVGQMIGIAAPNVGTMYASRVFSGVGLGALSVTGTLAIVEVAPAEIRGLLASWYSVMMSVSLACAQFCCYGVYLHLPASLLQYRIVMFAPCLYLACWIAASFFLCESPRWLYLVDRPEHAVAVLAKLRGLNTSNPRVQKELEDISNVVREETELYGPNTGLAGLKALFKELFTVKENLRRGSIVLIMYALPILSGANSITSYLVPILDLIGNSQTTQHDMFVSSMYSTSKIFYTLIASFLVIDALGRRKSVFVGATIQFITHIYIGSYIKVSQEQNVSKSASEAALAAIFLHGFGYSIGEFVDAFHLYHN
jgi:MFS family permease